MPNLYEPWLEGLTDAQISVIRWQMASAAHDAWDSLSRYKFVMFGYWAGVWVNMNRLLPKELREANPFTGLVKEARNHA